MTNELEKHFFDTFGIAPKLTFYDLIRLKEDTNQKFGGRCSANWKGETKEETIRRFSPKGWKVLECKDVYTYPQITDRILLELICICNSTYINGYINYFMATGKTIEEIKEEILKKCITLSKDIKHKVRTLFEEG